MPNIKFNKKQYKNLIKLVYLGNWMINAIRTKRIKKYEDIEQYIYSFAENLGLEKYIEFDEEYKQFFPTREFEEGIDIEQYREDYDDEIFWDGIIDRLAQRDFIKKYGMEKIKKMDFRERIEKEQPFLVKYEEEFQKHGIERLRIDKK